MELREIAMKWWNELTQPEKGYHMEGELKHRHPQSLTGSEIEQLYMKVCSIEKYSPDLTHNQLFVFVYAKDGVVKALSIEESRNQHTKLLDDGYVHTATLEACIFINYIANCQDDAEILSVVKGLRTLSQT